MQADEAREFVKPFCTESDDHDYPQHNCRKCYEMEARLAILLARHALEARKEALELLQEYARQHVEEYGCDADPCDKCKRVRSLAERASKGAGGRAARPAEK